jgi:hypothetical protein
MMNSINKEAGKEIYGKEAKKAFQGSAADIIKNVSAAGGGITITANTGLIACRATAAQTTTIVNGKYAYDLEITQNSIVTRLVQGTIEVSPQVTRT